MAMSYGKMLARKAPPPDAMEALGEEPDEAVEEVGEDADEAAAMSAYDDFARLAGFKPSPKTFAAFKELVQLIVKPEHRRLHPSEFK